VGVIGRDGQWLLTNAVMDECMPTTDAAAREPGPSSRWQAWDELGNAVPPADWPTTRALRGETVVPGLEMPHARDDGVETWMRVSAAPLRDVAGAVIGASVVVQDIDLAKRLRLRLEDELRERGQEVDRAERRLSISQRMAAVGTLASGLAHDIRNVLIPLS